MIVSYYDGEGGLSIENTHFHGTVSLWDRTATAKLYLTLEQGKPLAQAKMETLAGADGMLSYVSRKSVLGDSKYQTI
ncbi:MAG: hypothetical protein AB7O44_06615 [Hyphomicrobiaceae bacterium]